MWQFYLMFATKITLEFIHNWEIEVCLKCLEILKCAQSSSEMPPVLPLITKEFQHHQLYKVSSPQRCMLVGLLAERKRNSALPFFMHRSFLVEENDRNPWTQKVFVCCFQLSLGSLVSFHNPKKYAPVSKLPLGMCVCTVINWQPV